MLKNQFKLKKVIALFPLILCLFAISNAFSQEKNLFPNLKKLEKEGVQVSAMVVRLNNGEVIGQLNPDKRLSPASLSKLVLAAKALDSWGPDKSFTSKIYMRGKLNNGTLNGDLIFYGVGDPYLTNEKLWFLTTDVFRYGIKKVTGKILVNNSYFGTVTEDINRASGKIKSQNAYDSPLSSSAVNFGVLAIVVNPGQKQGTQASITLEPYSLPNTKVTGSVTTSKAGSTAQISVSRTSRNGKDTYTVSGNIPIDSVNERIYRSVSEPDLYAGETINAFLQSAGVETTGLIDIETTSLKKNDSLVAQVVGYPIDWQLKGLFQVSNNFIADMLALNLLNEVNPKAKGDLKESGVLLQKYLESLLKSSVWGQTTKSTSPLIMESGSGLTPNSRLSARDIISVLDQMYFSGRGFPAYLSALPIPGDEGTLKKRFSSSSEKHLQGRLRAKTGTLTEPIHVSGLGGYSRLNNGDWVSFAIIVNGIKSKPQIDLKNLREAIDSDLAKVLPSEL